MKKIIFLIIIFLTANHTASCKETAGEGESATTLMGVVTYRERIALPPNSQVQVMLEEVGGEDGSIVIIEQKIITDGEQVPIPFALNYNSSQISSQKKYQLRARICDVDGQVHWVSQSYPVLDADEPPSKVNIVVNQIGKTQ